MTNRFEWKEWPSTPNHLITAQTNETVERLREQPGRSALVETSPSKQATKKWRRRGCVVAAFPSETQPGAYDLYAKWPHPDDN